MKDQEIESIIKARLRDKASEAAAYGGKHTSAIYEAAIDPVTKRPHGRCIVIALDDKDEIILDFGELTCAKAHETLIAAALTLERRGDADRTLTTLMAARPRLITDRPVDMTPYRVHRSH